MPALVVIVLGRSIFGAAGLGLLGLAAKLLRDLRRVHEALAGLQWGGGGGGAVLSWRRQGTACGA